MKSFPKLVFIVFLLIFLPLTIMSETFIMVPKGVHPYYIPCYEGFKEAGKKYGVSVDWVNPSDFVLDAQIQVIEELIFQQVDGIAISALDDKGLIPIINQAINEGIKVITFDAPAPSTKALTYVGTNNEAAGFEAGKKFAKILKAGKVVILQGGLTASNLNLRTKGFKEAIKKTGQNIEVIDVIDTKGDIAHTVNKVESILKKHPNLKGIFSVSALGAPAAATVVKQKKKSGAIIVAGFDDLKETINGIKDGSVSFCLVQKTFKMGWLSIEMLLDAKKGKSLPKEVDTGVIVVDKSNVNTYLSDMKKELLK